MNTLYGFKKGQIQAFDDAGIRVPITAVDIFPAMIIGQRTNEKNGYTSWQIGLGTKKHLTKSIQGLLKNLPDFANASTLPPSKISPRIIREIRTSPKARTLRSSASPAGLKNIIEDNKNVGDTISVADVFAVGDIINVAGVSSGKGFAGVVKRHGFHGSQETHGTSNRQRHAGSIGATTTPGRVYKGKRMAGHMGSETITIRNLQVFAVKPEENLLLIKGLVPGKPKGLLKITKILK